MNIVLKRDALTRMSRIIRFMDEFYKKFFFDLDTRTGLTGRSGERFFSDPTRFAVCVNTANGGTAETIIWKRRSYRWHTVSIITLEYDGSRTGFPGPYFKTQKKLEILTGPDRSK